MAPSLYARHEKPSKSTIIHVKKRQLTGYDIRLVWPYWWKFCPVKTVPDTHIYTSRDKITCTRIMSYSRVNECRIKCLIDMAQAGKGVDLRLPHFWKYKRPRERIKAKKSSAKH